MITHIRVETESIDYGAQGKQLANKTRDNPGRTP
jgi:hypothetical protein